VLPESLSKEKRRPFDWKRAHPLGAFQQISKYRDVLPMLFSFFLLYLAAQAVMTNWQYYSMLKFDWNEKQVGFSIMMVGVLVAIVQGALVRVVNAKIGNQGAVLIGLALYALGLFLFAIAPSGIIMLLAAIPYCIGGINGPAMQAIMSSSAPPNTQGELQGVITSTISVTAIIGPPMMAGIFAYFTSGDTFYFPGAAFFLAGIFVCFAWMIAYKTLQHEKAQ
jgi:DHA1 family tetracycline resistance protein-like MFS transporter